MVLEGPMDGDTDDLNFTSSATRRVRGLTPRRGRRSGPIRKELSGEMMSLDIPDSPSGISALPFGEETGAKPPPLRGRRSGGWADELKSAKGRREDSALLEQERLKSARVDSRWNYDSDDDGPAIPNLDEVQEEDLAMQVAAAPSQSTTRVATYKELDKDLMKHAAFATMDDIDLRVLTGCMSTEADLKEPDIPWKWDVIFTEVTSEIGARDDEDRVKEGGENTSPPL